MTSIYWLARTLTRAVFCGLAGGIEVINGDKRILSGPAIIAANHSSYLDPPIVAAAYPSKIAFLARSTLFRGVGAWLYPRLNAFPIDREHADLKSMKNILRRLKGGSRILMFPEGTRSHTGELQEAKAGIGMLVAKSGVPVQPVRIFGAYECWPRGGKFRPHRIQVVIGDPIEFAPEDLREKSREAYQRIADRLMKEIAELSPKSEAPGG